MSEIEDLLDKVEDMHEKLCKLRAKYGKLEKLKKIREMRQKMDKLDLADEPEYVEIIDDSPISGGAEGLKAYADFIRKINKKMFMKDFYGKGKRKAQSALYELAKALKMDGADESVFKMFVKDLDNKISSDKSRTHSLTKVTDAIKEFAESYDWKKPKHGKLRKI